jgi:POTRA domain, FtsQ-type
MSDEQKLTRSELVRLRRIREDTAHMERAAKEVTRPLPPVTTRTRPEVVRPKRKPARNTRRRFNIALHMPRAETRSIYIPRPRFGWRLLSFLLIAVLGTALYFAFNLPELRVTQAQVVGNQLLSPEEVNSVMNVAGQPIFLLIPSELETRLRLNYPELVSVKVTVSLPNLVYVKVSERQPVVRWEQGGGYTWISEDGIAFKPRGEMSGLISVLAASAPPLEGSASSDPMTPAPFISAEMVRALKGLAGHVPPGAMILYDAGLGFGWNDPRGWQVYFGTSAYDVELKMRVYESMVNSLTQRGIRPALINVMYPTAPYYRINQ